MARGTAGQLVGGTVWVQVAAIFFLMENALTPVLSKQIQNPHP